MKDNLIPIFIDAVLPLIFIISAFLWGDWKNWTRYYPTILFVMLLDLFAGLMMYNHPLWYFEETVILPNDTLTNLVIVFAMFPATVLIFLANYPKKWSKQIVWILFWIVIFSLIEYIASQHGRTTYHNSWSFRWSVLFNCITFPVLRLHHSRPLLAWLIGLPVAFFIFLYFNFSITDMK